MASHPKESGFKLPQADKTEMLMRATGETWKLHALNTDDCHHQGNEASLKVLQLKFSIEGIHPSGASPWVQLHQDLDDMLTMDPVECICKLTCL